LIKLQKVPGVKKIFAIAKAGPAPVSPEGKSKAEFFPEPVRKPFKIDAFKRPWYIYYLQADRVWKEFGITGRGTLNVIHDSSFLYSPHVTYNLYRNQAEIPGNGKDDDNNGLVDDYHGFNFINYTADMNVRRSAHGYFCAAIVCGAGVDTKHEFGVAPEGKWAGILTDLNGSHKTSSLEAAVEWSIEHGADTYSMSFSIPNLAENRTLWRKIMEHGSFCGIHFVSGAGNFGGGKKGDPRHIPTPYQMRTPEDIPEVVFAAAGIHRNFALSGGVKLNARLFFNLSLLNRAERFSLGGDFGLKEKSAKRLFCAGEYRREGLRKQRAYGKRFTRK